MNNKNGNNNQYWNKYEINNLDLEPTTYYKFNEKTSDNSKFIIFKFKVDKRNNHTPNHPKADDFFKQYKPTGGKRSFSDFSIHRFLESDQQLINEKISLAESLFNNLKQAVENPPRTIKKFFSEIENRIALSYSKMINDLDESQDSIFANLDKFYESCIHNAILQENAWVDLENFFQQFSIDFETINYFLSNNQNHSENEELLKKLKNFHKKMQQKKIEFHSFISMYKVIEFKPTFSTEIIPRKSLQHGIIKCIEDTKISNKEKSTPQIERLHEFIFSKPVAPILNSFQFECNLLTSKGSTQMFYLNLIENNQRILICQHSPDRTTTDFYLVDLFGNLITKTTSSNSSIKKVCTNSTHILIIEECHTGLNTDFYASLYTPDFQILKKIQISSPVCSFFDDKNLFLLTSSMPTLQVYDKNLNLSSKISISTNPNLIDAISVRNNLIYLKQKKAENLSEITIININTNIVLKSLTLPFEFCQLHLISPELLFFLVGDIIYCFDLNRENIRYKVKIECDQENTDQAYCLTDHGFLLTLHNNKITFY